MNPRPTCKALLFGVAAALAGFTASAIADSCMVSPTDKQVVSGRFGKFRGGGAGNHGSANATPHMHDGLDFSTSNSSQPLYATTEGKIIFMDMRGTAGNTIIIKRGSGDTVAYYHLTSFAKDLKKGSDVTPGQLIGYSGNTPSASMAKHLHFVYGTVQKDAVRAKTFAENAHKGPFNPAQLASVVNKQGDIGWKTDPAPYFCATYPIQDGHPEHYPILGKDTKEQHAILFGSVPPGGEAPTNVVESAQTEAANADAALAAAEGKTTTDYLSETETFGSIPSPPIGDYETQSYMEMMMTEANRRFGSWLWKKALLIARPRSLLSDYTFALGVSNNLAEAIRRKKERVEALLAVYTSQRLISMRKEVEAANEQARRDAVKRAIN